MSPRASAGIGAGLGAAAGFLGAGSIYLNRSWRVQTNAAIWGTFLGAVFGAVIGAPSEEALKNQCLASVRFP